MDDTICEKKVIFSKILEQTRIEVVRTLSRAVFAAVSASRDSAGKRFGSPNKPMSEFVIGTGNTISIRLIKGDGATETSPVSSKKLISIRRTNNAVRKVTRSFTFAMAARPTEVGRSSSSVRAQTLPVAVSDQINVGLKLGDQELTFDKGVWSRVARRAGDEEPRPVVDTAEIERLRKLLDEQKSRADSLEQEKQLLLLKNRILTEMVRMFIATMLVQNDFHPCAPLHNFGFSVISNLCYVYICLC